MKSVLFLCIGILFSVVNTYAQTAAYTTAATQCLQSNGTTAFYETVFNTCFKQIQDQYIKYDIPSEEWTEFKALKPEAMKTVNGKLVTAYSDFFTLKDIENMNALYASQAGQTMIKNPSALTKKDKKQIDNFYKTSTGKKIVDSQSDMKEQMQVISDFWCGEIYKTVNDKLEAKGYAIR
ncbi:conserved hypothetical protein [Formosa agariphila KMM 3901]|uniref:DUF2059 domain-containing protein n=1 Tax=Formosa agariphila (strain DSM 15362 / KCTC 12365 / LMG 23005 / KMM 3901 / M-2Alg 35-1) TaxID=1347342 RepID=T2KQG0_FORAG|nr:hypothetical protein [Formosa agariphila]CDF80224.1 conserved hypothetical protein [Formosa agariphila KMM 3901]